MIDRFVMLILTGFNLYRFPNQSVLTGDDYILYLLHILTSVRQNLHQ